MGINEKILKLYDSKLSSLNELFKNLLNSSIEADKDFSWPLMLRIWEKEYESAPVKLMVFGQETYGWKNQIESAIEKNTAETLSEEYVLFDMGHNYRSTPFWETVHRLNKMVGNPDTNCFVWNNILKFGKDDTKGAPSAGVLKAELEYFNVIPDEIRILNPDLCIFLTGPDYDRHILNKFPDVEFIPIEGYETRKFARIKSQYLPENSFRTYHPGYGYRKHEWYQGVLDKIVELSK